MGFDAAICQSLLGGLFGLRGSNRSAFFIEAGSTDAKAMSDATIHEAFMFGGYLGVACVLFVYC